MMGSLAAVVRVNAIVRSKRFVLRTLEHVQDCVLLAGMAQLARQVQNKRQLVDVYVL